MQDDIVVDTLGGVIALRGEVKLAIASNGNTLGIWASSLWVVGVSNKASSLGLRPGWGHGTVCTGIELPELSGAVIYCPQGAIGIIQTRGIRQEHRGGIHYGHCAGSGELD